MKIAAIITVDTRSERAQAAAIMLQTELLDRLGNHLHSVRLVAPRLFNHACDAAIGETPDALVVFCDGRLARRVGQVAYDNDLPVGVVCPQSHPASPLCRDIAKEDMLEALSRGNAGTARIDAGAASGRVFFEHATCGAAAHLAEWESGIAPPDTSRRLRLMLFGNILMHPNVRVQTTGTDVPSACGLMIATDNGESDRTDGRMRKLHCIACAPPGTVALAKEMWNALRSRSCWHSPYSTQFDASQAIVDAGRSAWFSLDGEPVRFEGAVRVRIVPRAVETIRSPAKVEEPKPFAMAPDRNYSQAVGFH